MYINKLTITSIFEKNKNLLQAINPEKERAIGLIKDRLDTRNGFFVGDNIPKRTKFQKCLLIIKIKLNHNIQQNLLLDKFKI